jgi:hypothetical protein
LASHGDGVSSSCAFAAKVRVSASKPRRILFIRCGAFKQAQDNKGWAYESPVINRVARDKSNGNFYLTKIIGLNPRVLPTYCPQINTDLAYNQN